jgi:hypothetical protein
MSEVKLKFERASDLVAELRAEQAAQGISQDEWMKEAASDTKITVEELDSLCSEYKAALEVYQSAKAVSDVAYKEQERLKGKVVEALEQAGKSKYVVEGIGTFYFIDKMSVKIPKDLDQKKAFFKYLHDTYGDTVYWDKVSVHSATLNSFYNAELEQFNEKAKAGLVSGDFHIPGLEAPTAMRSLGLRSEKK